MRMIGHAGAYFLLFFAISAEAQQSFQRVPPRIGTEISVFQERAHIMYQRIVGHRAPIDHPKVLEMEAFVRRGDLIGAAKVATAESAFINNTIRMMAASMSTREESIRAPLSDFVATFMGVVRDDIDARQLLVGNFIYQGPPDTREDVEEVLNRFYNSNDYYRDLNNQRLDLFQVLRRVDGQQIRTGDTTTQPNPDAAGVLTSRAYLEAHATAGTNRRPVEFAFRQFLCIPIEGWADSLASDVRIGRDIDRFPGGDHEKFLTTCKSCHTGMDGFRGAFAKYDFNDKILQGDVNRNLSGGYGMSQSPNGSGIARKMNANTSVYPFGYATTDDSFVNNANRGANSMIFGWRGSNIREGRGVREFGNLIANSRRFSACMTKRAFETVCRKGVAPEDMNGWVAEVARQFEQDKYDMRSLFERVVALPNCVGDR